MTAMCPCGQPLHYASDDSRDRVEEVIATTGEDVQVTTPRGAWLVPRRFLALHGIKADELPDVAADLGFRRVIPLPQA